MDNWHTKGADNLPHFISGSLQKKGGSPAKYWGNLKDVAKSKKTLMTEPIKAHCFLC